jgi:hypothetical protein
MELPGAFDRRLPASFFRRSARRLAAVGSANARVLARQERARSRGRFDRGSFE